MSFRSLAPAVLMCMFTIAGLASAQPLGTFRWQQQPYCNVVSVNVVQNGGVFQLDGADDQCGAATQAAVVGIAFLNPDGTVGLGMTLVTTPGGTPLHIDATISVASGSGTWRDSSGTTGPFVLTPGAGTAGSARPVPRASFPAGLSAGGTTITNVAAPVAATDAATKAYVDAVTASVRSAMLGEKVWKAIVNSNGSKQSTGPFTSSTSGTGAYRVEFDVTGLGLPQTTGVFALGTATTASCGSGTSATISGRGTLSVGGLLTRFSLSVLTTNAAGAATNCTFDLLATFPDANAGSPIPPLGTGGDRPGVTCATVGDVTTCVTGPAPQ